MNATRRFVAVAGLAVLASSCGGGYPTNVKASIAGDTVTITWDGIPGVGHYDVCRKMEGYFGSSGDCSFLTPCTASLEPKCVYKEAPTPKGELTTYTYRARADDGQWGEWSNPIQH